MEQKTRIKGNVHYVGVNDRNKHRFEALWPLPYGVSYNSYLIDDEMVALVDTVDICYFEVYLRKIDETILPRSWAAVKELFQNIRKMHRMVGRGKDGPAEIPEKGQ